MVFTVISPNASIYLCECFSMGLVKERYFFKTNGDKFLRQTVSGMKIMATEFDMSPPYFDTKMVSDDVEKKNNLMNKFMGW